MEIEHNPCQDCPIIEQLENQIAQLTEEIDEKDDELLKRYMLNRKLQHQNEQMKNCQNCKYDDGMVETYNEICMNKCKRAAYKPGKEDNWQLKEAEP
jgi:hypothetical protein